MEEKYKWFISDEEKNKFISTLTCELISLRAKLGISQEEIANIIGISRQSYGAIERKSREMSWNTYLSLILFFDSNDVTRDAIRYSDIYPYELIKRFNNNKNNDGDIGLVSQFVQKKFLNALDKQALATIRSVITVEYSRCNNVSCDAVIKYFDGLDFVKTTDDFKHKETTIALKKIKGHLDDE